MNAIAVIFVGDGLLWERGQAWVVDPLDLWVCLQPCGQRHSGLTLLPDPECHGLGGLRDDEGSKRVDDIPVDVLHVLYGCVCRLIFRDHRTPCHHVVALVILRQALDHHVATPMASG